MDKGVFLSWQGDKFGYEKFDKLMNFVIMVSTGIPTGTSTTDKYI
ncbi:MAG: hypothetical protein ACI4BB_09765 [Coprococcus sp.]